MGEEIGKVLMPMIQSAAVLLKEFAVWLQGLSPAAKTSIVAIGGIAAAIGPFSIALGSVIKMLPALKLGLVAITGPVGLVTTAILGAAAALAVFKANSDKLSRERISDQAQKYISSGMSVDELKRMREEALAKNLEWNDINQRMRDATNPLKAKSLSYFVMNYFSNDRDREEAYAKTQLYYEKVMALDEAISALSQTADGAGVSFDGFLDTFSQVGKQTEKNTGLIASLEAELSRLEAAKKSATSTYEIHNLTLEIATLHDELERLQQVGTASPVVPASAGLFGGGVTPLTFDPSVITPSEEVWASARERFAAQMAEFVSQANTVVMDMMPAVRNLFSGIGSAIGEGLGDIISGDGTFEDLLGGIVRVIGQFLKSLGQQLIELGVFMLAIKEAVMASFSNPWTAIAVGIAAVALGAAMISAFNKRNEKGVALAEGGLAYGPTMALVGDNRGAGSDPEVIAPLSKLRQYGLGRQTIEFVGGQFRLSGSDLLLAIQREDARVSYVNAL